MVRPSFFLDKKKRQKNQAKNILPPHMLTHARIFGNPTHINPKLFRLNKALSVCSRAMGGQKSGPSPGTSKEAFF
jgi:hypothetical protein